MNKLTMSTPMGSFRIYKYERGCGFDSVTFYIDEISDELQNEFLKALDKEKRDVYYGELDIYKRRGIENIDDVQLKQEFEVLDIYFCDGDDIKEPYTRLRVGATGTLNGEDWCMDCTACIDIDLSSYKEELRRICMEIVEKYFFENASEGEL